MTTRRKQGPNETIKRRDVPSPKTANDDDLGVTIGLVTMAIRWRPIFVMYSSNFGLSMDTFQTVVSETTYSAIAAIRELRQQGLMAYL